MRQMTPRDLTAKGLGTRQRIVEGAAATIRERGVAATTLDDVLDRTSTSKGQLFHYFPGGKDELFLAVARHEANRMIADQQPQLDDLTSWPAWLAWRDQVVAHYRRQDTGCVLTDLAARAARLSPGARAVVRQLVGTWQARLTRGICHLQSIGEADPDLDADRVAAALLAGIQGGVAMSAATGDLTHLEAALDVGIDTLRASRPTAAPATAPAAGSGA